MKEQKIELLRQENFQALINSYAVRFVEDSAEMLVEKALRGHAKLWGGCVSCVFSRACKTPLPKADYAAEWTRRNCVLGLEQDTCGEHLDFPKEEKD